MLRHLGGQPQASLTVLPDVIAALQPCAARGGIANYRSFALYLTSTSLYLGGTCTAETTGNRADLGGRVDRLDLTTGSWSNALGMTLTAYDGQRGTLPATTFSLAWQPWSNDKQIIFPAGGVAPRPIESKYYFIFASIASATIISFIYALSPVSAPFGGITSFRGDFLFYNMRIHEFIIFIVSILSYKVTELYFFMYQTFLILLIGCCLQTIFAYMIRSIFLLMIDINMKTIK